MRGSFSAGPLTQEIIQEAVLGNVWKEGFLLLNKDVILHSV